jgi:hypothetical protein
VVLAKNFINTFLSVSLGGSAEEYHASGDDQDPDAMQVIQVTKSVIAQVTSALIDLIKSDIVSKLENDVIDSMLTMCDSDTESDSGAAKFSDDGDEEWRLNNAKVQ